MTRADAGKGARRNCDEQSGMTSPNKRRGNGRRASLDVENITLNSTSLKVTILTAKGIISAF
jgi:hypothetical protein